jgi:23S rRNA (cytidine2498-2'-O)-methyltransferase
MLKPFSAVYVAKKEFIAELCDELGGDVEVVENLVFSSVKNPNVCFALDIWFEPVLVEFESISEAVRVLRGAGKYWYLNPVSHVRRSRLIEEQLVKLPDIRREFPQGNSIPDVGCFSLLGQNTLLYAVKRWKKAPLGETFLVEDKKNPPNRAYLKLWEALTLLDRYPQPNETAFDLGASPGGWTYVMQSFGAKVTAIDKAPLDPAIAKLPKVTFLQQSAFALNPNELDKVLDWVVCDIACYPDRLYDLVINWINSNKAKQMIFTIKLQGKTDIEMIKKFQAIPNSRTLHMFNNKHEATFFYPASPKLFPLENS